MVLMRELGGGCLSGLPPIPIPVKVAGGAALAAGGAALAAGGDGPDEQAPSSPQARPTAAPGVPAGGGTGDPVVDQYLMGIEPNAPDPGTLPDPIGGIAAQTGDPLRGGLAQTYRQGDETTLWRAMPFEDRVRLQDELVSLGLASSVIPGELDDGTIAGFSQLLALSNRRGTDWRGTLGRLQDLSDQGLLDRFLGEEAEYQAPAYIAPDYATLARQVRETFRQHLGREPEDTELAEFVAELQGWDKQAYKQQQDVDQAEFAGTDATLDTAVDPMARFNEAFDRVYSGEIAFIEDKQEAARVREFVDDVTTTVSGMAQQEY